MSCETVLNCSALRLSSRSMHSCLYLFLVVMKSMFAGGTAFILFQLLLQATTKKVFETKHTKRHFLEGRTHTQRNHLQNIFEQLIISLTNKKYYRKLVWFVWTSNKILSLLFCVFFSKEEREKKVEVYNG